MWFQKHDSNLSLSQNNQKVIRDYNLTHDLSIHYARSSSIDNSLPPVSQPQRSSEDVVQLASSLASDLADLVHSMNLGSGNSSSSLESSSSKRKSSSNANEPPPPAPVLPRPLLGKLGKHA